MSLVASALLAVAVSLALLTTSAEPASSPKTHTSFGIDEKSINGVDAYTWAATGSALVYATGDGTLWSANGPAFAKPNPINKIAVPNEHQIEQIVWSADGRNIAVVSARSNDL